MLPKEEVAVHQKCKIKKLEAQTTGSGKKKNTETTLEQYITNECHLNFSLIIIITILLINMLGWDNKTVQNTGDVPPVASANTSPVCSSR